MLELGNKAKNRQSQPGPSGSSRSIHDKNVKRHHAPYECRRSLPQPPHSWSAGSSTSNHNMENWRRAPNERRRSHPDVQSSKKGKSAGRMNLRKRLRYNFIHSDDSDDSITCID